MQRGQFAAHDKRELVSRYFHVNRLMYQWYKKARQVELFIGGF